MIEKRTYKEAVEYFKHPPFDISGYVSDDVGWSDRMILEHILDVRATEMRREVVEKRMIDRYNYQTLECVSLEESSPVEAPGVPPPGCIWLKSTQPLPRILQRQSVTSLDGGINFNYVEWTKFKHKTSSRIKSNRTRKYYTLRDVGNGTHLYILNDEYMKAADVTAVFSDPYAASVYPKCGDIDLEILCNPWDADIKTDRPLFDRIMLRAWQTLPVVRKQAESDIINDDTTNARGVVQPKL